MMARLKRLVRARLGQILGGHYLNDDSRFALACSRGHQWEVSAKSVARGSWCRRCWNELKAGKHLKLRDGLTQANTLAKGRAGECLSTQFESTSRPLKWRCANGHIWLAALADIKKGTWCPRCGAGARERLCRDLIEAMTGREFPRVRPEWLLNSRGNRMELDGFSDGLGTAFEHQGEHHYRRLPHFQRRKESLATRQSDDARKRELCKQRGISLLEIPFDVPERNLPAWLRAELRRVLPMRRLKRQPNLEGGLVVPDRSLKRLQDVASSRGGACLTTVWLGVFGRYRFRCGKGHEWIATASNVLVRTWCPVCKPDRIGDANRKHSIATMNLLAKKRGGRFLSETFESVNHRYEWQCKEGHHWIAAPTDIQKGTWCPLCAKKERMDTIEAMQRLARTRSGACLSRAYRGQHFPLRWRCAQGHTWMARPGNVKNNRSWCPICARSARRRI
jgi:hypothetical protein